MHPARLYLLARLLSALLGTATIALTFLLGRTLWNVRAGLIAALMLSVAMLHVRDSHFFKPEAALGLFTTAALLACVRLERSGSWRTAAEAGVLTGLALGVKQSPAPLVPLGLAALLARGRPPTAARPSTRLLVAGAATAATVVLTTPYMILDYRRFAGWMAFTRLLIQSSGEGIGTGLRYHVEHSWLLAQGPLLSLSTLAALVWQVTERRLFLVNAFVLVSLLQLGTSALAYTRYLTPVLPPLCIITATGLDRLLSRVTRARLRGLLTAVVLAGLLGRPLYASLRFDQIAAEPDTRLLARAWLEAHVPAGTPVLVLGAPWPYTFGDPDLTGYRVRRNPTLDPSVGIRYVVVHEHPIRFSRPPDGFAALAPSLRLETTISPFEGEAVPPGTVFETHDAFYVPLWGFRGVVRGGPIIRIYSVVAP
jgi:4-amino-4-deoxy-L-arabinose transferase-like glycosyltransferase